ncbi:Nuclear receptor 2C2-associated protein [Pseudolycoriella hygida]|uniref:Nuclear receptor 2C2-associated protein n=1 Tax=Pseudolycoriella hygida TaxID=35572 RepID=A0A9Q0MT04_9DIPT|nr:Nuclear receptor 2C2-associated protein [Pseudolycoriella hygida]
MGILDNKKYKCSVSSVLNRDNKQHGKSFLFDGCEDTAWSSDQGASQWIVVAFEEDVKISSFAFQFQGGFAGKNCSLALEDKDGKLLHEQNFYPDDINAKQTFNISSVLENVREVKFSFDGSTDFFGRIIVYNLELH